MSKTPKIAAQAAKQIRNYIKNEHSGLKASVTSKNYSGGDSVSVYLQNADEQQAAAIKTFSGQYEMGHFDGMDDSYKYSNRRDDLPQVSFVFVYNNDKAA